MSKDAREALRVSPETEHLLSTDTHGDTSGTYERFQPAETWSTNEAYLVHTVPPSNSTPRDKSTLNSNASERSSNEPVTVITLQSIIVNDDEEYDNPPPYATIPPPYSAIAPPNHIGWPYGLFSSSNSNSTDAAPCRAEIPLAPFQPSRTSATGFYPEGTNGQHASIPIPLTSYQFLKFGCRRSSHVQGEVSFPENWIAEKTNDRKSRRYSAILMAAAVIIFLMVLSLMVRFVMERSWWRG